MPSLPYKHDYVAFHYKTDVLFSGAISTTHSIGYTDTYGFKLVYTNNSLVSHTISLNGYQNGTTVNAVIGLASGGIGESGNGEWFTQIDSVSHVWGVTPFSGQVKMVGRGGDRKMQTLSRGNAMCNVKRFPNMGTIFNGVPGNIGESNVLILMDVESFTVVRGDFAVALGSTYRVERAVPMKGLAGLTHHYEFRCEEENFNV